MIDVVAGIIEIEGKYLICKRRKGTRFEGRWEFPGGTVENGETYQECLHRELKEELGIDSVVRNFFDESVYDYGHKKIRLLGYLVDYVSGDLSLNAHDEVKWVFPNELRDYDFADADIPFVERLINL